MRSSADLAALGMVGGRYRFEKSSNGCFEKIGKHGVIGKRAVAHPQREAVWVRRRAQITNTTKIFLIPPLIPPLLPTSTMGSNGIENLQMTTPRVARIDYEMLNSGPDSRNGGLPSDQLTESDISQFLQFDPDPPSTDQESLLFSDI